MQHGLCVIRGGPRRANLLILPPAHHFLPPTPNSGIKIKENQGIIYCTMPAVNELITFNSPKSPETNYSTEPHLQIPEKNQLTFPASNSTLKKPRDSEFTCRRSKDSTAPPSRDPKLSTEGPRDAGGRFNAAALNISGNFHS